MENFKQRIYLFLAKRLRTRIADLCHVTIKRSDLMVILLVVGIWFGLFVKFFSAKLKDKYEKHLKKATARKNNKQHSTETNDLVPLEDYKTLQTKYSALKQKYNKEMLKLTNLELDLDYSKINHATELSKIKRENEKLSQECNYYKTICKENIKKTLNFNKE